jgi:uncharacterized protein YndB with AHSA1/START domain
MSSKKNKVSSKKIVKEKKAQKASKSSVKPSRLSNIKSSEKKKKDKPEKAVKSLSKKGTDTKKIKSQLKTIPKTKSKNEKLLTVKKSSVTNKGTKKTVSSKIIASQKKPVTTAKPGQINSSTKSKTPVKTAAKKPIVDAKKIAKTKVVKKAEPKQKSVIVKKIAVQKDLSKEKKSKPEKTEVKKTETLVKEIEKPNKTTSQSVKKSVTDRPVSGVLAISNTIPIKQKNEISPSKIASISNSITNPIKKTDSYAVKPEKEPSGKFELEFVIHSSAEMLYEFLSTPSGLSEWFCDDLNIRNGIYTFIWDDQLQQARLLKTVDLHLVRFQWVDKIDGSYFEFRIQRDDLTNDISLIITDFAENVPDRESSKLLWNSQIEKLMHVIGSIF